MSAKRVSRRDWIEAAYEQLVREGERGVGINALAAGLGVTKGSFYWHFKDRADLVQALLDRWAYERTDEIMMLQLGSTTDPMERLRRMQALALDIAPLDRAMRLWAQHDPKVSEAVRHADSSLVRHLSDCLRGVGFSADQAELRAMLMLKTWAGGYLVQLPGGPEQLEEALKLFLQPPPQARVVR